MFSLLCLYGYFLNIFFFSIQQPGLTEHTSRALHQTCEAITQMSKYLLENCGFNYVLLGKIQSDMIERRFSRIRQLSGANYYISMRQLQESDRKIRSISLLKYSQIFIAEIDIIVKTKCTSNNKLMATAEALQAELLFNILPTENDAAVIFYVTGYCCKSLVKSTRCVECKTATVATIVEYVPPLTTMHEYANKFFDGINCGGLRKPTTELYEIGCLCWKVFAELCNSDLKKSFLSAENQQEIFKEIVNISYFNDDVAFRSLPVLCSNGHNIVEGVSIRFYNCMCKNLICQLTEKGRRGTSAKIRKLNSN